MEKNVLLVEITVLLVEKNALAEKNVLLVEINVFLVDKDIHRETLSSFWERMPCLWERLTSFVNQMSTRDRRSSRGTAYCHQCHIRDWPVTGVFPETPNWCLNEDVCRRVGDNAPTNWI